jgi:hypothetical protein
MRGDRLRSHLTLCRFAPYRAGYVLRARSRSSLPWPRRRYGGIHRHAGRNQLWVGLLSAPAQAPRDVRVLYDSLFSHRLLQEARTALCAETGAAYGRGLSCLPTTSYLTSCVWTEFSNLGEPPSDAVDPRLQTLPPVPPAIEHSRAIILAHTTPPLSITLDDSECGDDLRCPVGSSFKFAFE